MEADPWLVEGKAVWLESHVQTLLAHDNWRDGGIVEKRGFGIVLTIALALSAFRIDLVSAAQQNGSVITMPSGKTGAASEPARKEKVVPFDPNAPPKTRNKLAPFLTFGGKFDLEYVYEKNFDLNDGEDDDLSTLEPELQLAFSFDPSRYFHAFLNLELSSRIVLKDEQDKKETRTKLEIDQALIALKDVIDRLAFQIGRQRFKDERQWVYDERLDAVRILYRLPNLSFDLSVSRKNLFDGDLLNDAEDERINNYIVRGTYNLTEDVKIAGYTVVRDAVSSEEESPIFFGLHSNGEILDDLEYWIELAYALDLDGSRDIDGIGLDIGASYQFDLPLKPSVTLGYAFGDENFRQTGLEDNEDRFHGVTKFKYYGELVDPELSNLSIFTGGIGSRPSRKSSIDLVYHYYLQDEASKKIRGSPIDADPTGLSRSLGSEIDLVVGYEEIRNVNVKLVLGYFIPGEAFAETDDAFFANFEIQFSF